MCLDDEWEALEQLLTNLSFNQVYSWAEIPCRGENKQLLP